MNVNVYFYYHIFLILFVFTFFFLRNVLTHQNGSGSFKRKMEKIKKQGRTGVECKHK